MSLKDLLVCKFAGCNKVYNDARILPCGKRTCAAHIDKMMLKNEDVNCDVRMIKCHLCEEIHNLPDNCKEFPVDEYIPQLLNIRYCFEHDSAKKSFNEVTQLLEKLTKLDKEGFVIDYFERAETDILLEKEANIQKLVIYYQKLVDEVHERKLKCLHDLKTNERFVSELDGLYQTLLEHENRLKKENVDFILKTLDGDEAKWKDIQSECSTVLLSIKSIREELKERIIGSQIVQFNSGTSDTQIESICGHLSVETINSGILNYKMRNDLITLCKLRGKQFTLLYRATRDGFEASSFHAKCDNQPRTLTIIRTTKGYVFGAYVDVAWDSVNRHKSDPNAFIFSLINARKYPHLIPIRTTVNQKAVYCHYDYGPVFGAFDICVKDHSNSRNTSYSELGKSYDFQLFLKGTKEAECFLASSSTFQTSDFEVFQLN